MFLKGSSWQMAEKVESAPDGPGPPQIYGQCVLQTQMVEILRPSLSDGLRMTGTLFRNLLGPRSGNAFPSRTSYLVSFPI